MKYFGLFVLVLVLSGCAGPVQPVAEKAVAPAKVSGPVLKEGELATVTLTPQAEGRLGIRVAPVAAGSIHEILRYAADVVLPPGRSLMVTAAVSGTLRPSNMALAVGTRVEEGQVLFTIAPLLPLPRDLRVTAEAEVQQARTRVETAKLRKARADQMLKDEVGTVRAQEDAGNELDLAQSALDAAQARLKQIQQAPLEGDVSIAVRAPNRGMLRQVLAAPGQAVTSGTPLLEIADFGSLWLRMPVYAGERSAILAAAPAQVETLSGEALGSTRPVTAPPTGDPLSATVDFYYQAPAALRLGEKVSIGVPVRASRALRHVPSSAIVFDVNGGTWVYQSAADHRYVRRRVFLQHTMAGNAYLATGPLAGTPVVTAGAAELWGVEFGAGK